jgi:hypothetical protein
MILATDSWTRSDHFDAMEQTSFVGSVYYDIADETWFVKSRLAGMDTIVLWISSTLE